MLDVILQQGTGAEAGKNRIRALYMYLGQHCLTVFTDVVDSVSGSIQEPLWYMLGMSEDSYSWKKRETADEFLSSSVSLNS